MITVKTQNNMSVLVSVNIVDPNKITDVTLSPGGTSTLNMGSTLKLTPMPTPSTASATYTWTTSNAKVATVKDGVVTPVAEGTAVISVKTVNYGKSAYVTIKVVDPNKKR